MASARRRVEMAMATKAKMTAPHVQINTHVEDPQKSLEELFTASMRTHEQRKHYERKKHTIPLSFNQRPVPVKSRGSSAGHSREGSSDDGLSSSGRHTLSPSSVSSIHFSGPYQTPVHTRQGSAPALIDYTGIEHQTVRQPPTTAHAASKSLSVMTMSETGDQFSAPAHRAAKSCDLDNQDRHLEMNYTPDGQPYYIDHNSKMTYWADPRGKSQSLDPLALGMNERSAAVQEHPLLQSYLQQGENDDVLGPLPEGWVKSYDPNGDPYFIDHINQTTTWYDPRIPRDVQEERIRLRHGRSDQIKRNIYEPQETSSSLVHQLQIERRGMQERQQQLCREGLIEPHWQNSQPYQPTISGIQPHNDVPQLTNYANFYMPSTQPLRSDHLAANYYTNARNNSNETSMLDSNMEVDYVPTNAMGISNMQATHQIDPNIVRELTAQDLNPRDFDQYLQLNDNRSPTAPKQYM